MPSGVVCEWTGPYVDIPYGWALCDGTNQTPNLRNRFIIGADGVTHTVGQTGSIYGATGPTGVLQFSNGNGTANYSSNLFFNSTTSVLGVTGTVKTTSLVFDASNVRIGAASGQTGQALTAIAIGYGAGQYNQQANAIAIGFGAGQTGQGSGAIAIGTGAGQTGQGLNAIAIGTGAGQTGQGSGAIAIGTGAGQTGQGAGAIAIGFEAGQQNNLGQTGAIAIGPRAGQFNQGTNSISIGSLAGQTGQGLNAIAIGFGAGANGARVGSDCHRL